MGPTNKAFQGVLASFHPSPIKKKLKRPKHEFDEDGTPHEAPYLGSTISLEGMARIMMHTYPPPPEFYDFWQTLSRDKITAQQNEIIESKTASLVQLASHPTGFDAFHKITKHELAAGGDGVKAKKISQEDKRFSDIWKGLRITPSEESLISSSTKISENASAVGLETGWEEPCSEDYQSSESDFGFDVQDKCRHHRHKQHWTLADDGHDDVKPSSFELLTPQTMLDKQYNAVAQSMISMKKRDNKTVYDLATIPGDVDIIDHFADDMDETLLGDTGSYTKLPSLKNMPNFETIVDNLIVRLRKAKKVKKPQHHHGHGHPRSPKKSGTGIGSGGTDELTEFDEVDPLASTAPKTDHIDDTSLSECSDSEDENCIQKRQKRKEKHTVKAKVSETTLGTEYGYDACMKRRRERIEDALRAAVRCRSPMGSYRPKPGEEPLSKALGNNSPGPAAYNPQINCVKPNTHTALLAPRWVKNIYETIGPGPAQYLPQSKCTCEMHNLHEAPRFVDEVTIGPGPAFVNLAQYAGTAKDKPKAIILSRKPQITNLLHGKYTDCSNLTRYGKHNPPNPLILGRKPSKEKFEPGPGKYTPKDYNTKLGILLKSRIPPIGNNETPGFVELPVLLGDGPAFSFGIRNFMDMKAQSPGPIYQINKHNPKPISLTFRPFPMSGREDEPSPIEWGLKPGANKIKVLRRAPCPIIHGSHETGTGKLQTPGPNKYYISECLCVPAASFKGRYPQKMDTMPGPADYTPIPVFKQAPRAVFEHKDKEKPKGKNPGFDLYDTPRRIVGGVMTPRWKEKTKVHISPEMLNTFGLCNRGPKSRIPVSLKSRHTPFKYSHMADSHEPEFKRGDSGNC